MARHIHGLLDSHGLQCDGDLPSGTQDHGDVGAGFSKTWRRDGETIGAGVEILEAKFAASVGGGLARERGLRRCQNYFGRGHARAGLVLDNSEERAARILCRRRAGKGENTCQQQARAKVRL